jgi:hypothetical protein
MKRARGVRALGAAALVAGSFQAAGCGASKEASPARAPGGGAPADTSGPTNSDQEQLEEQKKFERGEDYAQPPPTAGGEQAERTITTLAEARAAFERYTEDVGSALSAGKQCEQACKAFGSMDRSSQRICDLNGPGDPDDRCKIAKERVSDARARLQRACGGCAESK